jgi:hypothetical protein
MMLHRSPRGVDPDRLRLLAKKASELHLSGHAPLTATVISVVKGEPDLSPEHVRRVVEFANNETFQALFQKSAGDHRVINFEGGPADPSDVLKELNMGAVSSPTAVPDRQMELDPYVPGSDSAGDPFDTAKTAEEYPQANPNGDDWYRREQLVAIREQFSAEHVGLMARYADAEDALCKEARQVVLSGGSTTDVSRALAHYSSSQDMTKLALAKIATVLKDVQSGSGIAKTAEATPNPKHPLVQAFLSFQKVAMDRFKLAAVLEHTEAELDAVNAKLRSAR